MKKIFLLLAATFIFACLNAQTIPSKNSTRQRPDSANQKRVRISTVQGAKTSNNNIIVGRKENNVKREVNRGAEVSLNPQPLPPSDPNKNKSKVSSKKKKIGKTN